MNWKSIISIMVAVIITAGVFIPVVSASTQEHISIKQVNNGAADGVDLGYFVKDENKTSPEVYPGAANVTVTNGVITLTYFESGTTTENKIENTITATDAILALAVSDTNLTQIALFIKDSKVYFCDCTIITTPREVKYCAISADRTVSTGNFYLTCSVKFVDGSSSSGSRAVDWAYLPALGGAYGSYTGDLAYELSDVVSVGYFADVFIASKNSTLCTFNDYDLSATIERDADGGVTGVKYARTTAEAAAVDGSASAYAGEDPVIIAPDDDGTVAVLTPEEWDGEDAAASTTTPTGTLVGDCYYTTSGTSATVTGPADSSAESIIIPNTVQINNTTYPVTVIGNKAFYACTSLTSISLPSGLTTIGIEAFHYCTKLALTSLPAGVTSIGQQAFANCSSLALTSLPAGVTSIGQQAFANCSSLALTSLPAGVTSIGPTAFGGCIKLALTSLPAGLTTITSESFKGTSLCVTTLPSGVTSIGQQAFMNCTSMTTLVIQSSPAISASAFPSLTEVLNFGSTTLTTAMGITNDTVVSNSIESLAIIQQKEYISDTLEQKDGAVYDLINILPIIILAGLAIATVRMCISRWD